MTLRTAPGGLVTVGQRLAAGGEGEVYAVTSPHGVVLKKYLPRTLVAAPATERKLRTMAENRPPQWQEASGHVTLAWPSDVVLEDGRFAGFLMPAVDTTSTVELHRIANPTDRREATGAKSWTRGFTWNYLVRTAANLAQATHLLHQADAVIGDFNERNILVTSEARVTLIDCDSMQIRAPSGEYFLCRVGRLDYTPPELLNANWETTVRQPSSDLYALAIHIYQLLLEGEHPFRGTWSGYGDKPDAHVLARQGIWAHKSGGQLRPRRAAIDIGLLPDPVKMLFRRAFEDGATRPSARPTAVDWQTALAALDRSLRQCRTDPAHFYPAEQRSCPWCRHERRAASATRQTTVLNPTVQQPLPPATAPVPAATVAAFQPPRPATGTATPRAAAPAARTHAVATAPSPANILTDAGLTRGIGRSGLFMMSAGSIFGAGWLFGAMYAAASAGPGALLAWIIGGVAILGLALMHAELCAMFPVAGGMARFPLRAFGGVVGASFGWMAWLQAATVTPIEVMAAENFLSQWNLHWWSGLVQPDAVPTGKGYLYAVLLAGVFTWVNFLGIRAFTRLNSLLTWWKIAVIVIVSAGLITHFHSANFRMPGGLLPYGGHGVLSAITSGGVIFAYLGFEQAGEFAGEARNPQRDVPWAIIASVAAAIVLYVLVQTSFIGALPAGTLAHGFSGLDTNPAVDNGVLSLAGMVGLTGALLSMLRATPAIAAAATGLTYSGATARLSYALGRGGLAPAAAARANRNGAPWVGMIAAFAVSLLLMLPGETWSRLVSYLSSASVLMYAGAPLCVGAFRLQFPGHARPYRVPALGFLGPATFTLANLIIYWSGWDTYWRLCIALVAGTVLILIVQRPASANPRAAGWVVAYLTGMGIIARIGQYGGGTGTLPMWWDTVAVAIFSVIIYRWAVRTRL